jgi:hypothetical protein
MGECVNRTGSYPLRDLEPLDFKKALETFQEKYSLAEKINAELDAEFRAIVKGDRDGADSY